ncbi:MAG TPA: hypothetical protein VNY83_07690 [Solirubrobacterales bacterium]|jgi:hypothetical protein|nr:hypothetical protein [Solirubrobacterales bacterium]
MGIGEILVIALAGLAAGAVNTVVGSGTLITFPAFIAVALVLVDRSGSAESAGPNSSSTTRTSRHLPSSRP